jgi:hypothetical protein
MEPSFFFYPLDRYETSLQMLRTSVHRKSLSLWITARVVAIINGGQAVTCDVKQIFLGIRENIQKYYADHYYLWSCRYEADA